MILFIQNQNGEIVVSNASAAAIVSAVNIILTGDRDFLSLDMDSPKCMTVALYFENEGVED